MEYIEMSVPTLL